MTTDEIRDFRRSLRHFTRITHAQLRHCCTEVTLAQCLVLLEVDDQEPLTVGQLAARLRLDDSTLSRTIDGLVRRGLLDRARAEDDRRVVRIRLTSDGEAACNAIHRENDAIYHEIFDKIAPSKREAVVRHFKILVQAFLDNESGMGARVSCASPAEEVKS